MAVDYFATQKYQKLMLLLFVVAAGFNVFSFSLEDNELQVYNTNTLSCTRFEQRTLKDESSLILLAHKGNGSIIMLLFLLGSRLTIGEIEILLGVSGGSLLVWRLGQFDEVPT